MIEVEINEISKNYKNVVALDSITLHIEQGELFGFIGPDGAGKTTLFRIMNTLVLPDKGTMKVMGMDVVKSYKQIRKSIGYMPGRFSLYQDLSIEENLNFFASIFDTTLQENYHLIKDIYVQIEPFKKRRAGKLSGGMKQKLALCCALIHKPRLLILDEPTTGVDAVSRTEFWEMLKKLKYEGITIAVSTPYMDEAALCDKITFMQNGKVLNIDSPENIVNTFGRKLYGISSSQKYNLLQALRENDNIHTSFGFGESFHITLKPNVLIDDILHQLKERGISDCKAELLHASIEDSFMDFMLKENDGLSN